VGGSFWLAATALCAAAVTPQLVVQTPQPVVDHASRPLEPTTLADAQSLFYNARYAAAAALALVVRDSETGDLASTELRSSALLFQLKALLEGPGKNRAVKDCATCPSLIGTFLEETHRGQTAARATLQSSPDDDTALFFLGKLDLNYVWLQLGPLGKKTGWDEYWEARRSLDAVLKHNRLHVRARVARAWIDYVVDTKMPWGTRWLLGGGDRKQALIDVREAVGLESDFFTRAEAQFALWHMQVRERDLARATDVARTLARDFPANRELAAFLEKRDAPGRR